MTLADLDMTIGSTFRIETRIRHPKRRIAKNGSHYLTFMIEDMSRTLKAYAWLEQCSIPCQLQDLDRVAIGGNIREFDGKPLANIQYITPGRSDEAEHTGSISMIPHSLCPEPALLKKLMTVVNDVTNETLRHFLEGVFADDRIMIPFVQLPASRRHHHSSAGGLLQHSLECVAMVQRFAEFSPDMLDLAVTAALLHDAGKVATLRDPRFCLEGVLLDHDALTLEVLAPHLLRLDCINHEIAVALRYLWTWRHYRRGMKHPVLTIAEVIAAADRISTGLNVEELTFRDRPEWQTVVRSESDGSKYWRPRLGYSG
jgi:3'-5' exoribonuclease